MMPIHQPKESPSLAFDRDIRLVNLNKTIINCKKCPRLVKYINKIPQWVRVYGWVRSALFLIDSKSVYMGAGFSAFLRN